MIAKSVTEPEPSAADLSALLCTLPSGRRPEVLREAFHPRNPDEISELVSVLQQMLPWFWQGRFNEPFPGEQIFEALAPPTPIRVVVEFSRLALADEPSAVDSALEQLALFLRSFAIEVLSCEQTSFLDDAAEDHSSFQLSSLPESVQDLEQLIADGVRFPTIYADPPWSYKNTASRGAASNHYPTLSVEEICREPVSQLAAENAHLHLWTTNAFHRQAYEVMDAWGFEFKSCLVWVKRQLGMGNYWRVSHEYLMLGTRGNLPFLDRQQASWIGADRGPHSAKPPIIRAMIEKVSPGPYLELYGREALPGTAWTVFGNEVKNCPLL